MVDFLHGDESTTDAMVELLFTVGNETQTSVLPDVARLVTARQQHGPRS